MSDELQEINEQEKELFSATEDPMTEAEFQSLKQQAGLDPNEPGPNPNFFEKDPITGQEPKDSDPAPQEGETTEDSEEASQTQEGEQATETKDSEAVEVSADDAINFYKALTSPIKANGRELVIKDPEDFIRLVQMGAGASKFIEQSKDDLAIARMFKKAELTDPDQLAMLIDIAKGNTKALAQFIKANEIDIYNLDTEDNLDYTPNQEYKVTPNELQLEQVMTELKDSEYFNPTLEAIDKFDQASIGFIGENPTAIRILHEHMQTGIFPKIMNEVQNRKLLGRLPDVADIEAYYQVGEEMEKAGLLNSQPQNTQSARQTQNQPPQKLPGSLQPSRSAGKGKVPAVNSVEELYALSDEKFNELFGDL